MSWSEKACERQFQTQAQSLDWRFGIKCQFTLRVQQKRELYHSSSRSCHWWSGMQRSQRMSYSSTIIGWNSSQSMKRSVQRRSPTLSRSPSLFRMSKETLLSPSMSASAILHHVVSSSCASDQLLQQCSAGRPQAHLSVRSVREDRDQFLQEGQRQRSNIKRTKRERIKTVLKFPESEG